MRLLLISNSTQYGRGYLDHCVEDIDSFLGQIGRVIFVPFALKDHKKYADVVKKRLAYLSREVISLHEVSDAHEALGMADALFVGGGNTFRLLKALYDRELMGVIRGRVLDGLPYVGSSAGANIACPTIKTTNDMPIVYPLSFEALNLLPFNINPHYLESGSDSRNMAESRDRRLQEFHEENDLPVLGLREGALLRREGGSLDLIGQGGARLFIKAEKSRDFDSGACLNFLLDSSLAGT